MWTNQCGECPCFNFLAASIEVPSEKVDNPVRSSRCIRNVCFPGEVGAVSSTPR